jgi:hypothetical protein
MNDIALNWQDLLNAVVVSMMLLFSAFALTPRPAR